mmetsp:Transcript_21576/g.64350  ORF Transcript_21576/g.64350 Transcript_21576/m.64350 type:complete len:131 (-) Transcript_21576:28-420(-)
MSNLCARVGSALAGCCCCRLARICLRRTRQAKPSQAPGADVVGVPAEVSRQVAAAAVASRSRVGSRDYADSLRYSESEGSDTEQPASAKVREEEKALVPTSSRELVPLRSPEASRATPRAPGAHESRASL